MKFSGLALFSLAASATAFSPGLQQSSRASTHLRIAEDEEGGTVKKVAALFEGAAFDAGFDEVVKERFPGALTNKDLETKVVEVLAGKGYKASNTLLATSLCCDELARQLEDDFVKIYGNNFNLGGLSGFPFAGNTGFGVSKMKEMK